MLRLFSARTSRRLAPLSRRVRRTAIAGAAVACLWALAPQEAQAVPPNAQEFTIRYFIIEPDGSRGPQLVTRDFQTQFNLARCHCGDKIRVLIQRRRGQPWDPGIMELRVGRQCDRGAQLNNGGAANYRPCLLLDRLTNPQGTFLTDVEFDIPIYWFSSGLRDVNHQNLRDPETRPHRFCPQITGSPGIWMCFGQDACQEGSFFLKPSVSTPQNPATPGGGGGAKQGAQQNITSPMLDMVAPDSAIGLKPTVNPGDGSVQIAWNLPSDGNVVGYRVLCRPANPAQAGWRHPAGKQAIETFPGDRQRFKTSTIYQLPQYLGVQCNPPEGMTPEGPQGAPRPERRRPKRDRNQGDSTQAQLASFEALQLSSASSTAAGQSSVSTNGGPGVTSMLDSGTSSDAGSATGTGTGTGSGSGNNGPEVAAIDPAFQDMDWGYLCSDHLPGSTRSARVEGLANETPYLFQLVAYDLAGNPALVGDTVEGTPLATVDYWDACNEGNVAKCGKLGFCAVSDRSPPLLLWGLSLLVLGLRKRKEQPCR